MEEKIIIMLVMFFLSWGLALGGGGDFPNLAQGGGLGIPPYHSFYSPLGILTHMYGALYK